MSIQVSFHNVDHSDALVSFIDSKSERLNKFLKPSEKAKCLIEHESTKYKFKLNLKLINKNITLSSKADNAFKAASEVFAKAKKIVNSHHKQIQH